MVSFFTIVINSGLGLCWVLITVYGLSGLSLVVVSGGYSLLALCRLIEVAFLVVEPRLQKLQHTGSSVWAQ